jgi:Ca2+-binding EF-hand superfamily protein
MCSQFQRGLGFGDSSSLFIERVFRVVFDVDGSGWVDFPQFVRGIHKLSHYQSLDDRVRRESGEGRLHCVGCEVVCLCRML